jgi:GH24 family phage-related lysozyme (muramidase)
MFCLFPTILFAQTRQKAIIDSIKAAAANLQNVSTLIGNYPGTALDNTHISDSGGDVTIVIRVHVAGTIIIPVLPPRPVIRMKTIDVVPVEMTTVTVPPLPPPVREADTILPLPVLRAVTLNTAGIPVKVDIVDAPPLPDLDPEAEALPLLAVVNLTTQGIPVLKLPVVSIPPLPDVRPLLIDALSTLPVAAFGTGIISGGGVGIAPVPPAPDIVDETIGSLSPFPAIQLMIEKHVTGKLATVIAPVFEEKKLPVAEMHLSDEGYSLLEKLEGFSPELYSLKDGGFTIGFGFFVPYSEGSKWEKGVTWEAAERIIREKVPAYENQVKQYINVPLTQEEFDALTMMAYNLGGFSKATSIVNDVNSNAGFDKLQSDWMRFVHSKAPGVMKGLINRRKDEIQVRNESYYQPERKIQILKTRK